MSERQHLSWRRAELFAEHLKTAYGLVATVAIQIRDGGAHPVVQVVTQGECRHYVPGHGFDKYFIEGHEAPWLMAEITGVA